MPIAELPGTESRGSIRASAWSRESGDPITSICPLARPNEAMAHEAQMEAWSNARTASRLREKLDAEWSEPERGGAVTPAGRSLPSARTNGGVRS